MDDRTIPDLPPESPASGPTPARRLRLVWWVLGPLLVLVAGLTATGAIVHAPYVMLAPGSAVRAEPLVSVPADQAYESDGEVLFTTVSVIRPTYLEALRGWLEGDTDVFPRRALFGDKSDAERTAENVQEMDSSKFVAAQVAFEHLGYEVDPDGVTLVSVQADSPASGVLRDEDVVVALDGAPVRSSAELTEVVRARSPGDTISVTVERAAEVGGDLERLTVEVTLGRRPGTDEAIIGVLIRDRFDFPIDLTIDSGDVGGPSAGLAWTLAVLDRLTPGSITGGARVAVTGAIDASGRVIEVGGVKQKALASRDEGATLFLVPAAEAARAKAFAGSMEVVGVDDLDDALDALAAVGGNADDLGRPGD